MSKSHQKQSTKFKNISEPDDYQITIKQELVLSFSSNCCVNSQRYTIIRYQ